MVSHHFPFFSVAWMALKGTATSFSPMPRKPPTDTMKASTLPSLLTSTSLISPILLSDGSYTFCLYQLVTVEASGGRADSVWAIPGVARPVVVELGGAGEAGGFCCA